MAVLVVELAVLVARKLRAHVRELSVVSLSVETLFVVVLHVPNVKHLHHGLGGRCDELIVVLEEARCVRNEALNV